MKVISMYIRGLILIISICIFVYNNYKKKITREIESTSPRYIALKGLQDKYKFNRISREMPFILILDSKYKYDHVDYQKQIYKIVCCNRDVIENIIEATEENNRLYEAYKKEHSALPAFRDEIIDDISLMTDFSKAMTNMCSCSHSEDIHFGYDYIKEQISAISALIAFALNSESKDLPSKIEGLIYNTSISPEEIYDKLTLPQNIVSGEKIK